MKPESRSRAKPKSESNWDNPLYLSVCLFVWGIVRTPERITMGLSGNAEPEPGTEAKPESGLDQEGIKDQEPEPNYDGCMDHSDIGRHKRSGSLKSASLLILRFYSWPVPEILRKISKLRGHDVPVPEVAKVRGTRQHLHPEKTTRLPRRASLSESRLE
ncbi:hypothetical protein EVAR_83959_1 [Eumeta japonica]|uniref:Uncharacterized protein n=1 Tax=Eumeta variegata TaxID=151549 RepID=A0A4C1VQ15_EUMVA|nr:hypothetical protein EVAR_83959_1 [Eumeta japonica]